jgi:hypothetical protein
MRRLVEFAALATHILFAQIIHQDEDKVTMLRPRGRKDKSGQQKRGKDLIFHSLEPKITPMGADYKTKKSALICEVCG